MKRHSITTQMKKQTRNIEIQINEEEMDELPGKEFRIMMKDDQNKRLKKKLENWMDKIQESINKDLEE